MGVPAYPRPCLFHQGPFPLGFLPFGVGTASVYVGQWVCALEVVDLTFSPSSEQVPCAYARCGTNTLSVCTRTSLRPPRRNQGNKKPRCSPRGHTSTSGRAHGRQQQEPQPTGEAVGHSHSPCPQRDAPPSRPPAAGPAASPPGHLPAQGSAAGSGLGTSPLSSPRGRPAPPRRAAGGRRPPSQEGAAEGPEPGAGVTRPGRLLLLPSLPFHLFPSLPARSAAARPGSGPPPSPVCLP